MRKLLYAVAALWPLVVGCSDDADPASSTTSGVGGSTTSATSATDASATTGGGGGNLTDYPAGPYGTNVGDTVAFVEFEGFLSPTAGSPGNYVDVDMLDIRNAGSPAVLLHLAAMF